MVAPARGRTQMQIERQMQVVSWVSSFSSSDYQEDIRGWSSVHLYFWPCTLTVYHIIHIIHIIHMIDIFQVTQIKQCQVTWRQDYFGQNQGTEQSSGVHPHIINYYFVIIYF